MYYTDTSELLEALNKYIAAENMEIQTEIKDWKAIHCA